MESGLYQTDRSTLMNGNDTLSGEPAMRIFHGILLSLILSIGVDQPCVSAATNQYGSVNLPSSIVDSATTIKCLYSQKIENEGPIFDYNGNLYFSERPASTAPLTRIWKASSGNSTLELFRDSVTNGNGLGINLQNCLIACEKNKVTNTNQAKGVTVLFDKVNSVSIGLSNDLSIASDGGMYVTCPDINALVYWAPGAQAKIVATLSGYCNGVFLDEEKKRLYVGISSQNQILKFDVGNDRSLTNKRIFASGVGTTPDGFTFDVQRNAYVACWNPTNGKNELLVLDSTGKNLGNIEINDVHITNCILGGEEGKTLVITAGNGVYSIDLKLKGLEKMSGSGRVSQPDIYRLALSLEMPSSNTVRLLTLSRVTNAPIKSFELNGRIFKGSWNKPPSSICVGVKSME